MQGIHGPWRGWDIRLNTIMISRLFSNRGIGIGPVALAGGRWAASTGIFTARRNARGGRFGIRTMLSAEPWTGTGCGS